MGPAPKAVRASVRGQVQGGSFREDTRGRAEELGVLGWVRDEADGAVSVHAEGNAAAVDELLKYLQVGSEGAEVEKVVVEAIKAEGHERFAIRGVSAGGFLVLEGRGGRPGFEFHLEVEGEARSWAVPKSPSMDPADKRLAIPLSSRPWSEPGLEEGTTVWDRGPYEQGGRVPWPEALDRGHAVFVLHGEKLEGGFALQRTGPGPKARWLLVKRREP
jgi:DNA ligase D-like protein (predicted 3'-phosphoesterase)